MLENCGKNVSLILSFEYRKLVGQVEIYVFSDMLRQTTEIKKPGGGTQGNTANENIGRNKIAYGEKRGQPQGTQQVRNSIDLPKYLFQAEKVLKCIHPCLGRCSIHTFQATGWIYESSF